MGFGVMTDSVEEQKALSRRLKGFRPIPEATAVAQQMADARLTVEQEKICADLDRLLGFAARDALGLERGLEEVTDLDRARFTDFRESCQRLGLPYLPAPPQAVAAWLAERSDRSADELEDMRGSIAAVHRQVHGVDPCGDRLIRAVIRTVRDDEAKTKTTGKDDEHAQEL